MKDIMKDIMDRVETYKRRAGTGVLIVFVLLLSAALCWADTTIYVYQSAAGALTVKTFDSDGNLSGTIPQTKAIPDSCFTPELFWDSGAGALRINGFNSSGDPIWTGTIGADGQFASRKTFQSPDCGSVTADALSAVYPDSIPCVSYTAWSTTCSNGFFTRTGIPDGCVGALLTIPCSNPPTTCNWVYGVWTLATCAAGTIQTRTATATPSGCIGFPDQLTIQSCPPVTCTSYNYTLGACQSTNTAPVISYTGVPAGCTGGITPATIQPCTYGAPTCTSWTYTNWSPTDAACTPGSTQTRQVATSSPTPCTGQPSSSLLSKACPTGSSSNYVLLMDSVVKDYQKIAANGGAYYKVVVGPNDTGRKISVTMGSKDYTTKQEMIIGKNILVTEADYTAIVNKGLPQFSTAGPALWYYITTGTTYKTRGHTIYNITAGDVYYIFIKNVSGQTGTYSISYNLGT